MEGNLQSFALFKDVITAVALIVLSCLNSIGAAEANSNTTDAVASNTTANQTHEEGPPQSEQRTLCGVSIGFSVAFASFLPVFIIIILHQQYKIKRLYQEIHGFDRISPSTKTTQTTTTTSQPEAPCDCYEGYKGEYEIPRDRLEIYHDSILSSGEFSCVFEGKIKSGSGNGNSEESEDRIVAIRTTKCLEAQPGLAGSSLKPTNAYFKTLLTELSVLSCLGNHENITSLLGAVTVNIRNREVFIAFECCGKGDLLNFIQNTKINFQDLFKTKILKSKRVQRAANDPKMSLKNQLQVLSHKNSLEDLTRQESLSTLDLLDWSRQISRGMEYISSKNVIHGDISLRNILLTTDNVAKISDFGLAHQLGEKRSQYTLTSHVPLPWRGMAIESLRDFVFSVKSDVWSFGVLLYEMYSLGEVPYAGYNWTTDFVDGLVAGQLLSMPEHGNSKIHDLMLKCMKTEPSERPSFTEIIEKLDKIKNKLCPAVKYVAITDCDYITLTNEI